MKVITCVIIVYYALVTVNAALQKPGLSSLKLGNSLSLSRGNDFLNSPNGTFSSGFYKVGTNAYCFSIWFTKSADKTVVWMANRDNPVNGKSSKLQLRKNRNLVLINGYGLNIWETNTFSRGVMVQLQLLESGNLVLVNQQGDFQWQSFDYPTNTLLPTQQLDRNTTLVSVRGKGTYLSGYYNYKFNDNNVLNLIYNGPLVSSVYWPSTDQTVFYFHRTPYNCSRIAAMNYLGRFKSSDNLKFNASDYGFGPKRRLTLDYDGILRLYSLDDWTGLWEASWWNDGVNQCQVHGQCGAYGICSYEPLPTCSCPYGFSWDDPTDRSKGCRPNFNTTCNADEVDFVVAPYTDYYGYDLNTFGYGLSLDTCRNACRSDCKCLGFAYQIDGSGECYPKRNLLNGKRLSTINRTMHFKVPKEMAVAQLNVLASPLNCSSLRNLVIGAGNDEDDPSPRHGYMRYLIAFVGSFGIIELLCIYLAWWFAIRKNVHDELENMGYVVLALGFKSFSYSELKKATGNFRQEIGKGGFGTVYKGILENGSVVAVKRLEGILQGESEFWAEVSIIGKLNHKNLVKMWGFCAENEEKMLVYDYMEKGSLDKILFSDSSSTLSWDQRYKIALGTAKGLSYIHEECLEWVLHCDIKPQNILLDVDLEPKVTDFGMSKLFKENQSSGFSRIRGTRGYLAPEWMMNMDVDAKADVYSYGIVLLELLSGRRAYSFQFHAADGSESSDLVSFSREKIIEGCLREVIDTRLGLDCNDDMLERLVMVCLLCVGNDRSTRPSMSKVVELLLGYGLNDEHGKDDHEQILDMDPSVIRQEDQETTG